MELEVDRRNLLFLESVAKLYQELIQGEASGLSRLQLDQVMQRVIAGRQALFFGPKSPTAINLTSSRCR